MDPYGNQALQYLESGLGYPIPSAYPLEKFPPIKGWTGRHGPIPTEQTVRNWMELYPNSNVLVRMAPDVIGIDVDQYEGKQGAYTLATIIGEHGPLPFTHISTARELPSGIYWFRLRSWMDSDRMRDPGEHVEVIRHGHRYACAPPSWHQGARAYYRWSEGFTPDIGDLAWLPTEWYVHLTRGCECFELERADRKAQMRRLYNRPAGEAGAEQARRDLSQAAEALEMSSAGTRNNMLSSIAGRFLLYDVVLNGVLGLEEVTFSLVAAAQLAGLDERETKRTIESAMEWAMREGGKR